jgi:gamma-glutamyltranspeptidase/glutathione hydrolase
VIEAPQEEEFGPVVHRLETGEPQSFHGMVAAANPETTQIAVDILEAGGNAIDAAVAAAFALGVSDPGDSGLGGATFILIRFADGRATAIDGSAIVPLKVDLQRLKESHEAEKERGMELSAVPASLAALEYAALNYGTLSMAELIKPSFDLAIRGYRATAFQEVAIRTYFDDVLESDYLKYFVLDDGETPPSIDTLQCRPVLANTLRRIAFSGSYEFYRGSMAAEIEADMTERGGFVSRADLGILRIGEITPLRGTYRDTEVLAFPYPAMGGAVIQALNILERYPQDLLAADTSGRHQIVAETLHIATVDHDRVFSDGASVTSTDRERLHTKEYAADRAALIEPSRPLVSDEYPPAQPEEDDGNTTQISVVDRWGNAVALTQSLGRFFGNKVMTPTLGFPYNSLLEGQLAARAREAIPSTVCPSIVVNDGEVLLVLGSGSSTRIPGIVTSVISNVVDRNLGLRDAVLAPRILWSFYMGSTFFAEIFPPITELQIDELGSFGYEPIWRALPPDKLSRFSLFGSVNAVHFDRETRVMTGVGDPRRSGHARGARF